MKRSILMRVGAAAMAGVLAAGCVSPVPRTVIDGAIGGQVFRLSNPKNTVVTNLVVEVGTNGVARLSIGYLSSGNDSNVVSAAYSGQASVVKEAGDAAVKGFEAGVRAAAGAVK